MGRKKSLHIAGIYCIKNKVNGKKYIGRSIDIKKRWDSHKYHLRNNRHDNKHLQSSWNKHGEDNFEFILLEKPEEECLADREQWYFDNEIDWDRDYNVARIAEHPWMKEDGWGMSDAMKKHLSVKMRYQENSCKISGWDAIEIRRLWRSGNWKHREIEKLYGLAPSGSNKITRYKIWVDLPRLPDRPTDAELDIIKLNRKTDYLLDFLKYERGEIMIRDGVINDFPETRDYSASTRVLRDSLSDDTRETTENNIFVGQLMDRLYPEYHTEIEMLILSSSNYTHREISDVLNISRLGVTKRIAKAREIMQAEIIEMSRG